MKSQKFSLKKIVEVEWRDATYRGGWDDLEKYQDLEPISCITVGYLVFRSKDKITLALTQSEDGGITGGITIPATWVKKIKAVK